MIHNFSLGAKNLFTMCLNFKHPCINPSFSFLSHNEKTLENQHPDFLRSYYLAIILFSFIP